VNALTQMESIAAPPEGSEVAERRRARAETALVAALPGIAAFAAVTGLALGGGGYFPSSWGWASLSLLLLLGVAFVAGRRVASSAVEAAMLIGFGGLTGWVLLSALWSESPWRAPLESQRAVLFAAGIAAVLAWSRRSSVPAITWGVLAGIAVPTGYALATRLFPERLGTFDPVAGYRLAGTLGYWNALGIFAAMGILLAVGRAAAAAHPLERAAAGALVPPLTTTVYFTFSRGAWIALAVGVVAAVALGSGRLRLLSGAILLAPFAAAAAWLASRSEALTQKQVTLSAAASEGRQLAVAVAALAAASCAAAVLYGVVAGRLRPPLAVRRAYAGLLLGLVVAGVTVAVARVGGPDALVDKAYDAFRAPPPRVTVDLNQRLLSFSGNGRAQLWEVAADEYRAHRLLGSGAGTYERFWLRDPRASFKVRDAHSLYVEVLAELGPVGLALLLLGLGAPLVAAVRARGSAWSGPLAGAYVAYLAHAGVDWDWEISAVTLAALFLGCALAVGARRRPPRSSRAYSRFVGGAAVAILCGLLTVGHLGNRSLASARNLTEDGRLVEAADAARAAAVYMPWSPEPVTALAEVQLAAGYPRLARRTFRQPIADDPGEWRPWYGLALASRGAARRAAFEQVRRLNRTVPIPAEESAS
jgi:hypothetical protein